MSAHLIEWTLRLLAVGVLLGGNAVFVASQYGLMRMRFSLFKDELEEKATHAAMRRILDQADNFARVMQLGVVLCTVGYALLFYRILFDLMGPGPTSLLHLPAVLAMLVAFALIVAVYYLFGELIPRSLGLQFPEKTLHRLGWPVVVLGWLLAPVAALHDRLTRLLLRCVKVRAGSELAQIEIAQQVRAPDPGTGDQESAFFRTIVRNALQLRTLAVKDILLPRNQVQYFDLEDDNRYNLDLARKTGHTRFPLCNGDLDHCIGLVHIKDVFRAPGGAEKVDFRRIRRTIQRVKPDDSLEDTLTRLLRHKTHMALVEDEFGGITGVVTLEQLLEELVGDIQDEFDAEEALVQPVADDVYLVSGLTPIHDLEEAIHLQLDHPEDVSTFGGLITSEIGRIPEPEDEFSIGPLEIAITEADERRVIAARVRVCREDESHDED